MHKSVRRWWFIAVPQLLWLLSASPAGAVNPFHSLAIHDFKRTGGRMGSSRVDGTYMSGSSGSWRQFRPQPPPKVVRILPVVRPTPVPAGSGGASRPQPGPARGGSGRASAPAPMVSLPSRSQLESKLGLDDIPGLSPRGLRSPATAATAWAARNAKPPPAFTARLRLAPSAVSEILRRAARVPGAFQVLQGQAGTDSPR